MQQMQGAQQQPGFGPPPKKSNSGLIVGAIVGVIVLGLIIIAVVASSGPTPEESTKQKAKDEAQQRKEEMAKRDAETKAKNEAILAPIKAAKDQASAIEAALRNENAPTLEGMFDWSLYSAYNKTLVDGDRGTAYLNNPLFAVGEWEKVNDRYTGKYIGKEAYGPDGLKDAIMGYIKEYFFGASDLHYDKAKTESDGGQIGAEINGTKYLGVKVFIEFKGGGKTKEFWLAAPEGSTDVRIINFVDGGALKALSEVIGKKNPRNTDDRNIMRDPNENKDPNNPDNNDPPENADPDANLPAMAKTGGMPTDAALVNAVEDMKRNGEINRARTKAIQTATSSKEKKATMGAFIDQLIDAVNGNDRRRKANISKTLYEIWSGFCFADQTEDKMVYSMGFDGQSSSDLIVRRWIQVYNNYKGDD